MDEHTPQTKPSGALTPPPHRPSTALAASSPLPPQSSASRTPPAVRTLKDVVELVLDRLDTIADRIRDAAGLR